MCHVSTCRGARVGRTAGRKRLSQNRWNHQRSPIGGSGRWQWWRAGEGGRGEGMRESVHREGGSARPGGAGLSGAAMTNGRRRPTKDNDVPRRLGADRDDPLLELHAELDLRARRRRGRARNQQAPERCQECRSRWCDATTRSSSGATRRGGSRDRSSARGKWGWGGAAAATRGSKTVTRSGV